MNGINRDLVDCSKYCKYPNCKAYHIQNSDFCYAHSNDTIVKGKVNITVSNDLMSLKKYLCQLAMDIRRGKVKPQVGNAVKNTVDSVVMLEDKLVVQAKLAEMTKALEAYQDLGIENAELASLELESEYKEDDRE